MPIEEGDYKAVGQIIIKDKHLKIDLFADNYDDKTLEADTWNGEYNLVWR